MFQRAISVATAGDRSKQQFEELMLPHLPALHRLASRLTGDSTSAEDLVQETYLKAFESFVTLRHPERARSWLFRILSRVAIDHQRGSSREVRIQDPEQIDRFSLYDLIWDEDPHPYSDRPHEDFLAHFQDEEVRAALLALPQRYRVPLLLLYVEDMTYGELAEILECPLGTVMSRLHRGRKILERELWECAKRRGLVKAWKPN